MMVSAEISGYPATMLQRVIVEPLQRQATANATSWVQIQYTEPIFSATRAVRRSG